MTKSMSIYRPRKNRKGIMGNDRGWPSQKTTMIEHEFKHNNGEAVRSAGFKAHF